MQRGGGTRPIQPFCFSYSNYYCDFNVAAYIFYICQPSLMSLTTASTLKDCIAKRTKVFFVFQTEKEKLEVSC